MKVSVIHNYCLLLISIGQVAHARPRPIAEYQLTNESDIRNISSIGYTSVVGNDRHMTRLVDGAIERRTSRGRPKDRQPDTGSPDDDEKIPVRSRPATPESGSSSGSDNSPLKNKGKGKERAGSRPGSPDRSPSRSKSRLKTADTEPSNNRRKKLYLGVCGSRARGKLLTKGNSSPERHADPPRRSGRTGTSVAARGWDLQKRADERWSGTKSLLVCTDAEPPTPRTKYQVKLDFPNYPTSGEVISRPRLGAVVHAFNARDVDPCNDDYEFGRRPPPKDIEWDQGAGSRNRKRLWSPNGKDIWTTEHALDGQIVQAFFRDHFERSFGFQFKKKDMPKTWRINKKIQTDLASSFESAQDPCRYLHQFWQVRSLGSKSPIRPSRDLNAMDHLLEVFPGENEHLLEFTLLPARLNGKKERLFSSQSPRGKDVISKTTFAKYTFHGKIDALRELVLLQKYLNEPRVRESFKDVSDRIHERLREMETSGTDGFMRKTDNYWQKEAEKTDGGVRGFNRDDYADEPDQVYKSLGLARKWEVWLAMFVRERIGNMERLKISLFGILKEEYREMNNCDNFTPQERAAAKKRMKALTTAIESTQVNVVKLASYASGEFPRPNIDEDNPFTRIAKTKPDEEPESDYGLSDVEPDVDASDDENSESQKSRPSGGSSSAAKDHKPLTINTKNPKNPKTPANQQH